MTMIFIDANIFIAYHNERDVHHRRALEISTEIESGKFGDYLTSDYVFNEVIGVTLRKQGKAKALLLGEQILKNFFILNLNQIALKETWKAFKESDLNLNLVDCSNLTALKLVDCSTIATFDEEFKKFPDIQVIS